MRIPVHRRRAHLSVILGGAELSCGGFRQWLGQDIRYRKHSGQQKFENKRD